MTKNKNMNEVNASRTKLATLHPTKRNLHLDNGFTWYKILQRHPYNKIMSKA